MSWEHDNLAPVDTLLYRSDTIKVGCFFCAVDHPCFAVSEPLDNDVFVLPRQPLWIRRNAGDYRFVEPGGILMHRAGSRIERRQADGDGERTYWFGVHPAIFEESLRRHKLSTKTMGGAMIMEPRFRYRIALFLKQLDSKAADSLAIEEEVLSLFFEICERRAEQTQLSSATRLGTAARQCRVVDNARAYLDAHLSETVSLQTVASATGVSLFHLCRVFRQQTGITMHEYRTRQRLGHALDRLVAGGIASLTELALDLGFSSHSHLSRVFQRNLGVPPSEIRSAV